MRSRLVLALCLVVAGCGDPTGLSEPRILDLTAPWETARPAAVGLNEAVLDRAVANAAAVPRLRSLLVARNGWLVLERYFGGAGAATAFDLRSVTKSVVGTLTGIAIAEGTLSGLDATVGQLIGAPYTLDAEDSSVTVAQLLTMSSGYQWDESTVGEYAAWVRSGDQVQYLLDRPKPSPGTFTYNSAAIHLLGVLLQTAAGVPLADYAADRLFGPIGVASAQWESLGPGKWNGGAGLDLTARDLLRFGQLILQRGRSGDRQVVPEAWVDGMVAPRYDWRRSYGAQESVTYGRTWWVTDALVAGFFGWGYGGQFIYVVPDASLVVLTTTEWRDLAEDGLTSGGLANTLLTLIVNDVIAAVER